MSAPTDPAVIEAIEAEYARACYVARRRATRRMLGVEPAPTVSPWLRRWYREVSFRARRRIGPGPTSD